MEFEWMDRESCVRRVFCLVKTKHLEMPKAIAEAIRATSPDGSYRYCNYPEALTLAMAERLKRDAEALLREHDRQMGRTRRCGERPTG